MSRGKPYPRVASLVVVAVLLVAAGCRSADSKRTDENREACDAFEKASGGGYSPREKDLCVASFDALGPNQRACVLPCVRAAHTQSDIDACKESCGGGKKNEAAAAEARARASCEAACAASGAKECACGPKPVP